MVLRRDFLAMLLAAGLFAVAPPAWASDDGGGSGSGNSGSGSSNSGSGSSNSGSGSSNSGSGSSNSGSGSSNSGSGSSSDDDSDSGDDDKDEDSEQDRALKAVKRGEALALPKVLAIVRREYPGEIVSVKLKGKGRRMEYRIRVIDKNNRLLNLSVNARTGQIIAKK